MTKKIGGHLGSLPRSFSPKSTDQNFEIAILFSIVETHNNYVFGGALLKLNFDQCLHTVMVIGKCTDLFRGIFWFGVGLRGGGYVGDLSLEEYVMGQEKFNEKGAGFSSITIKKNNEKINMKKFFN